MLLPSKRHNLQPILTPQTNLVGSIDQDWWQKEGKRNEMGNGSSFSSPDMIPVNPNSIKTEEKQRSLTEVESPEMPKKSRIPVDSVSLRFTWMNMICILDEPLC